MQKFINFEESLLTVSGNDHRKNIHGEFVQSIHGNNFKSSTFSVCMGSVSRMALTILL